ncbi:MAG: OB-fold domain-containing protein [Candidatus Bathyarchaeia archaeon]
MPDLLGFKCDKCGKQTYLKHAVCHECKGRSFSSIELDGSGKVITLTRLYAPPEGIEEMPLTLGIIELDNGVRLTAQLTDQNLKMGDRVCAVWKKLRTVQGREVYGFGFQPIT